MVRGMLRAVRRIGHHLVATTTSPSAFPAALKRRGERALRRRPFPYISAVSNQLMPPSSAALTMAFFSAWARTGNTRPSRPPPPENSIMPRPIGRDRDAGLPERAHVELQWALTSRGVLSVQGPPCPIIVHGPARRGAAPPGIEF